jgi:hypothetical protein
MTDVNGSEENGDELIKKFPIHFLLKLPFLAKPNNSLH